MFRFAAHGSNGASLNTLMQVSRARIFRNAKAAAIWILRKCVRTVEISVSSNGPPNIGDKSSGYCRKNNDPCGNFWKIDGGKVVDTNNVD